MQNKNKIIALVCATALLGANMIFAKESEAPGSAGFANFGKTMENTSNMLDQANGMYKKAMETSSGMQMPIFKPIIKEEGKAPLMQFVKKELSEEEKDTLKTLVDGYLANIKEIMPKMSSGTTLSDEEKASIKDKVTTLNKTFAESFINYVDSEKVEEFKKFVEINLARPFVFSAEIKKPSTGSGNIMPPKMDKTMKKEVKKFLLSQKTRDLFAKKLDQIPAEKKLEFYNKLITKIDLLITKSQAEKTKGMLQELKMITQEKINSLSQSSDEQKILDEVLNDNSSTTTTSSGETK